MLLRYHHDVDDATIDENVYEKRYEYFEPRAINNISGNLILVFRPAFMQSQARRAAIEYIFQQAFAN